MTRLLSLSLLLLTTTTALAAPAATLTFVRDGKTVTTLSKEALLQAVPSETFTAFDPYYQKPKTFQALPLSAVLEKAFQTSSSELAKLSFVLRASDGYTVPFDGAKLLEKGGYIAVADVEVKGWEPIGPGKANPAPFYVVWKEPSQANLETHPRPWQLATIEIASFDVTFPHTVPPSTASAQAQRGFRLFREQCIACHAINREGGRIGPDLNVPQSIVEYRPRAQIRAYIQNPRTFRYSNMPDHQGWSDADLDAVIAYFDVMKTAKHDPDAKKP